MTELEQEQVLTEKQELTNYDAMKTTFTNIGVKFEECDERQLKTEHPVPHAVKYLSVMVAHFHFDENGKFLGTECNGDGTFVPSKNNDLV